MAVRLRMSASMASWICRSVTESRLDVASSMNKMGAFFEHGACNGDALPLPARQPNAAFTDEWHRRRREVM